MNIFKKIKRHFNRRKRDKEKIDRIKELLKEVDRALENKEITAMGIEVLEEES